MDEKSIGLGSRCREKIDFESLLGRDEGSGKLDEVYHDDRVRETIRPYSERNKRKSYVTIRVVFVYYNVRRSRNFKCMSCSYNIRIPRYNADDLICAFHAIQTVIKTVKSENCFDETRDTVALLKVAKLVTP